jgi:hypothetical protein
MKKLCLIAYSILVLLLLMPGCKSPSTTKRTITENQIGQLENLTGDAYIYRVRASPDGKRIAYEVKSRGQGYLVVDGILGKNYERGVNEIEYWGYFSPDSQHIVYVADNTDSSCLVVDAVEGKRYDDIRGPLFSGDGKHMVFVGVVSDKGNRLVIDGVEQIVPCDWILNVSLSFDGSRIAYFARVGNVWTPVIDGIPGKESIRSSDKDEFSVIVSPDGKHVAYSVKENSSWYVMLDGVPGKQYNSGIDTMTFSSTGRLAYCVGSFSDRLVVVDGQEYANSSAGWSSDSPVFSKDGNHVVYFNGSDMIIDDNRITLKQLQTNIRFGGFSRSYESVIFSEDNTRTAWALQYSSESGIAGENKKAWEKMVVDGKVGAKYPKVGNPSFSPDGKHVAYGIEHFVVLDRADGQHYDSIVLPESLGDYTESFSGRVVFDDANHFHYIAVKDNKIYFVTEEITDKE